MNDDGACRTLISPAGAVVLWVAWPSRSPAPYRHPERSPIAGAFWRTLAHQTECFRPPLPHCDDLPHSWFSTPIPRSQPGIPGCETGIGVIFRRCAPERPVGAVNTGDRTPAITAIAHLCLVQYSAAGADVAEYPVQYEVGSAAQAGVLAGGGCTDMQVLRHERVTTFVYAAAHGCDEQTTGSHASGQV